MPISFEAKIKDKILTEFNEDLYRNFNMTMNDAGELYGWGYKYMHKILNRVFKNYGPIGLKRETKYIIEYLKFLLNKSSISCRKQKVLASDTSFLKFDI